MKRFLSFAILFAALASCGGEKMPIEGTIWKLTELNGMADHRFSDQADAFTFRLDSEDNSIAGTAACNRFFGDYALAERGGIDITTKGMTQMACPNMELEPAFVSMLDGSDRYQVEGDTLTLYTGDEKVGVFVAQKPQPME